MAVYWATSWGRVILMAAVGVSSATALLSKIQNPMVAIAWRWVLAGMTRDVDEWLAHERSRWVSCPACSAGLPNRVRRACSPRMTSMCLAGLRASGGAVGFARRAWRRCRRGRPGSRTSRRACGGCRPGSGRCRAGRAVRGCGKWWCGGRWRRSAGCRGVSGRPGIAWPTRGRRTRRPGWWRSGQGSGLRLRRRCTSRGCWVRWAAGRRFRSG